MDASQDQSGQPKAETGQPRVERNTIPSVEELGGMFDRLVKGGHDIIRQGRDAAGPLVDQVKDLGLKGETVVRQFLNSTEVSQALEKSAFVFRLLTTPNFKLSQVVDAAGQPTQGEISEVYGLEVHDPQFLKTARVAVGVQNGKRYLLYFDPATTNVVRGADGFDSIQATGPVLIGRDGGSSFVIDPITGGKAK